MTDQFSIPGGTVSKSIEQRLEDLSALTPEDLAALENDIQVAYNDADADDDVDAMEHLVDVLETVHDAQAAAADTSSADETEETPDSADAEPDKDTKDADAVAEVPDADASTDKVEDAKPDAAPEAVVDATAEVIAEDTDTTDKESLAMAASADFQPPADAQPVVASASTTIVAGSDIPGFGATSQFDDISAVNEAFLQRLNSVKRAGGAGSNGEQLTVATILASIPEERMLAPGDIEGNSRKIEAVTGLDAIVAAGGYCAPLAVKYDIFGMGTSDRPVRGALPVFGATRGGIRFVTPPKLGDYTSSIGLWSAGEDVIAGSTQTITNRDLTSNVVTITTSAPHGYVIGQTVTVAGLGAPFDGTYTIATVPTSTTFTYAKTNANVGTAAAAGTTQLVKPCMKVNCAAELTAVTDAVTLCLQFGNLMTRAYPELVQRHNALSLVQHARFAEQNLLNQISAQSTAVTSAWALGTARDFLLAVGKAAAAYRNRHRVSRTTPLRVIAPEWVLDAMREDLARQLPGDQLLATPDSIISGYLAARNVNITWHMDDTFALQGAGAIVDFPTTIKWFIFAEGTFLLLDGGTLDLGIIRDSALVGTNDYKTFVEVFEGVAKVGIESIQVTTTTHVTGATIGTVVPS